MSGKGKKLTYKELNDRIGIAFDRLLEIHQNMDYLFKIEKLIYNF